MNLHALKSLPNVGKEELKVRSIGHCAMLEEDATQLRGLLDTGVVLSVIPIETWE